ncbi:MAG: hydrogenase iron-sulfur subunit, partial [Anaerolineae bacterium]|nr:hydrogenase iron-sulfur subunit [Anaerolineae bacterium]
EAGAIIVATGGRPLAEAGTSPVAGPGETTSRLAPQRDAGVIAHLLHLPQDADGFFIAERRRLRPENHVDRGVYVCGAAHGRATAREVELEALSTAYRALQHLRAGKVTNHAPVAEVAAERCTGCGTCATLCPASAISLRAGEGVLSQARVDPMLCQACGSCAVACPVGAIDLHRHRRVELLAAIEAALASSPGEGRVRVLVLGCEWSSHAAAELAGARHLAYPSETRLIAVPCSARFDATHLLWAFHCGADGIYLGACPPGECHHGQGNRHAQERVAGLQRLLQAAGFDARRLRLEWTTPDDAEGFVARITAFTELVRALGPSPLRSSRPPEATPALATWPQALGQALAPAALALEERRGRPGPAGR